MGFIFDCVQNVLHVSYYLGKYKIDLATESIIQYTSPYYFHCHILGSEHIHNFRKQSYAC